MSVDEAVIKLVAEQARTTEELIDLCGGRSIVRDLKTLEGAGAVTKNRGRWITVLDDPEVLFDHGDHADRP